MHRSRTDLPVACLGRALGQQQLQLVRAHRQIDAGAHRLVLPQPCTRVQGFGRLGCLVLPLPCARVQFLGGKVVGCCTSPAPSADGQASDAQHNTCVPCRAWSRAATASAASRYHRAHAPAAKELAAQEPGVPTWHLRARQGATTLRRPQGWALCKKASESLNCVIVIVLHERLAPWGILRSAGESSSVHGWWGGAGIRTDETARLRPGALAGKGQSVTAQHRREGLSNRGTTRACDQLHEPARGVLWQHSTGGKGPRTGEERAPATSCTVAFCGSTAQGGRVPKQGRRARLRPAARAGATRRWRPMRARRARSARPARPPRPRTLPPAGFAKP